MEGITHVKNLPKHLFLKSCSPLWLLDIKEVGPSHVKYQGTRKKIGKK